MRTSGSPAGSGKKVVVVKKAGSSSGARPANDRPRTQNNGNSRYNSGSDDGMSYNPFAALLNK